MEKGKILSQTNLLISDSMKKGTNTLILSLTQNSMEEFEINIDSILINLLVSTFEWNFQKAMQFVRHTLHFYQFPTISDKYSLFLVFKYF
jgi:hypothetical protein